LKLVREHINEKFTQDSDPIKDMGIGVVTWDNFTKGDVLECKERYHSNYVGRIMVIYDIKKVNKSNLKIHFIPYNGISVSIFRAIEYVKNNSIEKIRSESIWYLDFDNMSLAEWKKHFRFLQPRELKLRESLNEKFTLDSDPIKDMGIGSRRQIEEWLKKYKITNYHINHDLTIDVMRSVNLNNINILELPKYIQFNNVTDAFEILSSNLVSLRGCPKRVGGTFFCSHNKLTTLEYAPEYADSNFFCTNMPTLTSLGSWNPKLIRLGFYCKGTKLSKKDIEKIEKIASYVDEKGY
jgi:hypothetical protein